jgi:trimethylamine--corrinoid protein Co-methyltransferase
MGLVGSATTLYPEEIILDHEACLHVFEMAKENRIDDISLAIDVIKGVGPRGHFLAQKHTREHIRRFRLSPLFRQKGADGKQQDPREIALEKFKHLEASHKPQTLPDEILLELDKILEAAEFEAKNLYGE